MIWSVLAEGTESKEIGTESNELIECSREGINLVITGMNVDSHPVSTE